LWKGLFMTEIDATIPRCSHGKILLGCPDDDCPEQQEFLRQHHLTVESYLEWQKAQARIFVREYLGLPPEVLESDVKTRQQRTEEYERAQWGWGNFLILEDYDDV
jgi:hypothetical protein